jgi:hypothetical protein
MNLKNKIKIKIVLKTGIKIKNIIEIKFKALFLL